jgi:hypothetical protein
MTPLAAAAFLLLSILRSLMPMAGSALTQRLGCLANEFCAKRASNRQVSE